MLSAGGPDWTSYGFHACPFGEALVMMAEGGVCGLAFIDEDAGERRRVALDDMTGRWPRASFREAPLETGAVVARIFSVSGADRRDIVPVVLIGTPFDVRVWRTLLAIPMGRLVSYAEIARHLGQPSASVPSAPPMGAIRSRSSCRAIARCAVTAPSAATTGVWRASEH